VTDIENRYGVTILIHGDPLLHQAGANWICEDRRRFRELVQRLRYPPAVRCPGDGSSESKFLHETLMYDISDIKITYDVLVVGAGPAGLFTAIHCAERFRKVLILGKTAGPWAANFC